jgi:DNA polymerase-3 subunit delta'
MNNPLQVLSQCLMPWLREPLRALQAASIGGHLGHAWLVCGARGSGKINLALAFADWLLESSGTSDADTLTTLGPAAAVAAMESRHGGFDHHPDLHWIFPEEGKVAIGVEQIRAMSDAVALKSFGGRAKVVIIEPAEAMTTAAANALLKTLEEPTEGTYLLLVSHQPGLLPATVRSRCQMLLIARPSQIAIADWLQRSEAEQGELDEQSLLTALTPLAVAEVIENDYLDQFREFEVRLEDLHARRINAFTVADEWVKLDTDYVLSWLVRRLQQIIRARTAERASNRVTVSSRDRPHNALASLTTRQLFIQLDRAERLRNQIGTGINVDLALRVLLLGFRSDRESI